MTPADLARAEALAARVHAGQVDKLGHPYLDHLLHVAGLLRQEGCEVAVQIIGLLHDAVEDTDLTLDAIRAAFGDRVAAGVDAMTRREGEDYFATYLPRLMANPDAREVKLRDSRHNRGKAHLLVRTDPVRAAGLEAKYAAVCRLLTGQDEPPMTLIHEGCWRPAG
jgi:hypothetical protein